MPGFLSRWRYALIGVGTSVCVSAFLLATAQPRIAVEGSKSGSVWSAITSGAQGLEGRATDLKFKLRGARPPSSDVIVLAADEKGAQRFGLWPWPRDMQARAYDRLIDAGVKVIALDIGYLDPSSAAQSSVELLKRLDAVGELPEQLVGLRDELRAAASKSPDDELEAVFKKAGPRIVQGVIPYADAAMESLTPDQIARYVADVEPHLIRKVPLGTSGAFREFNVDRIEAFKQDMVQTPLDRFARAGSRLGHFEAVTDSDGAIRHAALLMKLQQVKAFFPSIALQAAAQAFDAHIEPIVEGDELMAIALRRADGVRQIIPMEGMCAFMAIDYDGPGKGFTTLSMSDVIDGKFDAAAVKDKIVLVGVTITGLTGDQRVTPFSEMEPGVYTHAAALSNIVRQDYLTRSLGQILVEVLSLVLIGLLFGLVVPRVASFALKGVAVVVVLGAWWGAAQWLFTRGYNVSLVLPSLSILASSIGVIFLGYLTVDREKGVMRQTFTRYLGEDVMEAALANPERLNRGEKREMTVLFSDIRGFTTLSERMDPEQLADFINQYLSPMTQIVFEEKGTLDKYIGDAVMAFWNAPLDQEDHAVRGCRAAVKMLIKLDELKGIWRKSGYPELEIGIGLNTGPMVVGNMGSDVRVDYTVLGDSVNLGARLEGTNKEYDTRIIISENTWKQVQGQVVTRRLGAVRVKGKKQPVGIHELRAIGQAEGNEYEAIAAFEQALEAWTQRKFDVAEPLFRRVLTFWPDDTPTVGYLEELETFKHTPPPPEWDGVVTLKTK